MSEDRLLSAPNASEKVKESEMNFADVESTKNENYDADETLRKKTTMLEVTKINKSIREVKKENCNEDKILRDLGFLLDLKKPL